VILARLVLENFRQYAGEHVVDIPDEATIAVVGRNGAGKTTLFQAVEWCLYGQAPAGELATHGAIGATRVALTLRDPDGAEWVVERHAGRRGDRAAVVYRADAPEAPLAQGKSDVTKFVATRLIGLGHKAFVSTFFTRQKELAFLSEYPAAQRRREVMKLLGYDAIWGAQAQVSDLRKDAQALAKSESARLDMELDGRNVRQEVADALAVVRAREGDVAATEAAHGAAVAAHATARSELDRCRDLERQHAIIELELANLNGESARAMQAEGAAREGLRRLDAEAERRVGLALEAGQEDARAAAVAAHDAERRRAEEAARLRTDVDRTGKEVADVAARLADIVRKIDVGARLPAWSWPTDTADVPASAARLAAAVDGVDIDADCARAEKFHQLAASSERRDQAAAKLQRYLAARQQREQQRTAMLAHGDPATELAAALAARDQADAATANAGKTLGIARAEIGRLRPLVDRLSEQVVGDRCPTCDRPFTPADLGETLSYLRDQLQRAEGDERAAVAARRVAADARAEAERAEAAARERQSDIAQVTERIAAAHQHIEDAEHDAWTAEEDHVQRLADLGLNVDPDGVVVEDARRWAEVALALGRARPLIVELGARADTLQAERAVLRHRLAALVGVAYDANAHHNAEKALKAARDAATRVSEIDAQLARRPHLDHDLAAAVGRIAELAGALEATAARQRAVGFDRTALTAAEVAERSAGAAERAAADARTAARRALDDARTAHESRVADERRLEERRKQVDALRKEADNLDRMYAEFSLFDRYVAGLVAPEIADRTAEYLNAVTDGHYDKVELSEDFGLRIVDDGEAFPIESFSGGERDVAALCARLALSGVIGSQAARPPRFLVLDEVFGSLDQDRRRLVLETLGRLSGLEGDEPGAMDLEQLFIISHIEDVNESEIVDEAWRVIEERGASRIVRGQGGSGPAL
jgi:exonuclease SbcC